MSPTAFRVAPSGRSLRHGLIGLAVTVGIGLAVAGPADAVLAEPDPCGGITAGQTTRLLDPGIGDGTQGKGFLCGAPMTDFPPYFDVLPEQDAPDPIDPTGNFDNNYAYIIGPNGAAANWTGFSTSSIITAALAGTVEGATAAGFAAWAFPPLSFVAAAAGVILSAVLNVIDEVGTELFTAYEDMSGSDWDFYVPENSGSGDWHSWIFWDGFGEVQTSSIDPHLVNQYYYNLDDYGNDAPPAYVRLVVGVSQRPIEQGDSIVDTTWASYAAGNGAFAARRSADVAGLASTAVRKPAVVKTGRAGVARVDLAAGNQTVNGSSGNDELSARVGNNALDGGPGDDQLGGGPGDDVLLGGPGNDELRAFAGDDQLQGGPGSDLLLGHGGNDVLIGGSGDDVLSDARAGHGGGRTLFDGGPGRDFLVSRDGKGDDELHCGSGKDVVVADPGDTIAKDCELVMTHAPKRGTKPPSMGHPVGRPPGAAQPEWSMELLQASHKITSRAGRGHAPHWSAQLDTELRQVHVTKKR